MKKRDISPWFHFQCHLNFRFFLLFLIFPFPRIPILIRSCSISCWWSLQSLLKGILANKIKEEVLILRSLTVQTSRKDLRQGYSLNTWNSPSPLFMISMMSSGEWLQMAGLPSLFLFYTIVNAASRPVHWSHSPFRWRHGYHVIVNAFCTKVAVIEIRQNVFIQFGWRMKDGKIIWEFGQKTSKL